jgi:hypothetical protein
MQRQRRTEVVGNYVALFACSKKGNFENGKLSYIIMHETYLGSKKIMINFADV